MTNAAEKIWAYPTQSKTRVGIWRSDDDLAVTIEYTRSDVANAEVTRLRSCLETIAGMYIPVQPMEYGGDERTWVRGHVGKLRHFARTSLQTNEDDGR